MEPIGAGAGEPQSPAARRQRWSIPIARVAGVTIKVHLTFLALVGLVALGASDTGESPVAAVGYLVALFACVVAHEFAHAMVARKRGIAVREIELLPFGGVARLERIPKHWRDESAIAVAGPIASVAVATVLFLVAWTAQVAVLPPSLVSGPLLVRLAWVNLMLAGFNLLPAFPLDGGRVLRAVLERNHSRVDATRRAARISRLLAFAMIGAGALWNIWLLVIGFFVLISGRVEEAAVLVHAALGPTRASALASPCPVVLSADTTVRNARRIAQLEPQPAYPVVDSTGRLVGLVTPVALLDNEPEQIVGELTTGTSIDADASLEDALELIGDGPIAVSRKDQIVGVITADALEEYLRRRLPEVAA